ncbi:MAG: methyltransferase domain-containing protein, partial [Oscillospiraceae bacterium]
KSYRCPAGHCYDIAREGYVHLLPANQKHSKDPGDDRAMVQGRTRFLEEGYYAPLRDALCRLALESTESYPRVLDAGCGEGYYTAGIAEALTAADRHPQIAGIDLSKSALRHAARRTNAAEFAVSSVYRLPVANGTIDLIVNCFSPLAAEEFLRVLRPGGRFLYVVPAPRHLWQMKEILYETPYENPLCDSDYQGFSLLTVTEVNAQIHLASRAAIGDLFQMTPYFWKTPKEGAQRLLALDDLETEIAFRVLTFEKI